MSTANYQHAHEEQQDRARETMLAHASATRIAERVAEIMPNGGWIDPALREPTVVAMESRP